MRITLTELHEADATPITLLEILSIEGQGYLARLHGGEQPLILSDPEGNTCVFRSTSQVLDALADARIERTEMVHDSPYDEMIGLDRSEASPLRVLLSGRTP